MGITRRPMGNLGVSVAPVSLGTVKLGRNAGVRYPQPFELPTDAAVKTLLETAMELGINLIDTAPAYGESESRLGRLLPGERDRWLICSKAGESWDGESHYDFSAGAIDASVTASLARLGTNYLDIVLIHSDGHDEEIIRRGEAMGALEQRKQRGDIRFIGMSPKTPAGALAAMAQADVLMLTLNLEDTSHLQVIQEAHRLGRGVLVKKALASGHADPAESLGFVLGEPAVDTVVIGTLNAGHLENNVAAAAAIRGNGS